MVQGCRKNRQPKMQKKDMKKIMLPVLAFILFSVQGFSQSTIELLGPSGSGGPSGLGASIAPQIVTFYKDATTVYSPSIQATFSLSNQQFTSIEGVPGAPGTQFGGTNSIANNIVGKTMLYPLMNSIGGSVNTNYTACNSCAAGTGISTSANRSIELYNFSDALIDASGNPLDSFNARVQYADLTVTFNTPVNNPVLQLTGLGGDVYDSIPVSGGYIYYTQGFATEFDLVTPGLTLSKLSGNTALSVSSTQITNGAAHFGASTTPAAMFGVVRSAASGSVVVQGNNITSFTLRIFFKGDGGTITDNAGNTVPSVAGGKVKWAFTNKVNGDGFLVGLSLEEPVVPLPVSIAFFTATASGHEALLQWRTVLEENNKGFAIERSADGSNWMDIGFVNSKADQGNSHEELDYTFTDNTPLQGPGYYRLKQVDADSRFQYSTVRMLVFSSDNGVIIYPNPVKDQLHIVMPGNAVNHSVKLEMINAIGQSVYSRNQEHAAKEEWLPVSHLPAGMYFLKIQQTDGHVACTKIQIVK